jgi:hypothetical protein
MVTGAANTLDSINGIKNTLAALIVRSYDECFFCHDKAAIFPNKFLIVLLRQLALMVLGNGEFYAL